MWVTGTDLWQAGLQTDTTLREYYIFKTVSFFFNSYFIYEEFISVGWSTNLCSNEIFYVNLPN